jgi:hypothetical protein
VNIITRFLFPKRILPAFLFLAGFAQERRERAEVDEALLQPVERRVQWA